MPTDPFSFHLPHRGEPLRPADVEGWLREGVPTCAALIQRHGLWKWNDHDFIRVFEARQAFVTEIGFGIPCREAIEMLASAGPLVEIGAGTGLWNALVHKAGGDIIATDLPGSYLLRAGRFAPVMIMDAEAAVTAHPERHVLAVWPCYAKDWAMRAARAMQPGRRLFLVSEGAGGMIGDKSLFRLLGEEFEEVGSIPLPVWPTIGDRLDIFERK